MKVIEETLCIWMNGDFVKRQEAKIHVLSHSLHYGSAVFDGVRFYKTTKGPAIFRLNDHIERLFNSAVSMGINIPYSKEKIYDTCLEIVKINKLQSGYLRLIAFWGYGDMELNPEYASINLTIAVWPWDARLGRKPISVKISNFIKTHPKSTIIHAKISGNYQNSILARLEARKEGCDEALLLDYKGNIAEGPGENFFLVKNKQVLTPPPDNILPGMTRDTIIHLAKDDRIEVKEVALRPENIYVADELFFTGTAVEIVPISSIDGKKIKKAPGEITEKIENLYFNAVHGKDKRYLSWLSFVN